MEETDIKVLVRIRPKNQLEVSQNLVFGIEGNMVKQLYDSFGYHYTDNRYRGKPFVGEYSFAFNDSVDTTTIYTNNIERSIIGSINGENTTIFAYGQTGSGKTHTIIGTVKSPGIVPLAVETIFKHLYIHSQRVYILKLSYIEIYNDNIIDLFHPSLKSLNLYEDKGKVVIKDLTEVVINSKSQLYENMRNAENRRHLAKSALSERSSRGHVLCRVSFQYMDITTNQKSDTSYLSIFDLAGSECSQVNNVNKNNLTFKAESGYINKSLLSLTKIIGQFCNKDVINYRENKLTRVFQPFLQIINNLVVICTLNPTDAYLDESLKTLKFASACISNGSNTNSPNCAPHSQNFMNQKKKPSAEISTPKTIPVNMKKHISTKNTQLISQKPKSRSDTGNNSPHLSVNSCNSNEANRSSGSRTPVHANSTSPDNLSNAIDMIDILNNSPNPIRLSNELITNIKTLKQNIDLLMNRYHINIEGDDLIDTPDINFLTTELWDVLNTLEKEKNEYKTRVDDMELEIVELQEMLKIRENEIIKLKGINKEDELF